MKTAPKPEWKVICNKATGGLDITSRACPEGWVTVYVHSGSGYLALESAMCRSCEYDDGWHEVCPDFQPGAEFTVNAEAVVRLGDNIKALLDEQDRKAAAI